MNCVGALVLLLRCDAVSSGFPCLGFYKNHGPLL
jgi:hypothetical protein